MARTFDYAIIKWCIFNTFLCFCRIVGTIWQCLARRLTSGHLRLFQREVVPVRLVDAGTHALKIKRLINCVEYNGTTQYFRVARYRRSIIIDSVDEMFYVILSCNDSKGTKLNLHMSDM